MGPNTKATGSMAGPPVRESLFTLTVTPTQGSGSMTRHMVTVPMFMPKLAPPTKATGRMTCSMEKANKSILMETGTRAISKRERGMVRDSSISPMAPSMMVNGTMVILKGMEFINGGMVVDMKGTG